MGRQGGIGRFIGSCRQLVGYVDDGKAIWRRHNGMNKKKWRKSPSFEGQRVAARYFGAASAVAGDLWSKMPAEMRRLADGGGFNRLVGRCRDLMEADGQVWNLDDLCGLDLSADSSGPLAVTGSLSDGVPWRLSGVRELMLGIDAAVGPGAGQRSEKYIMANRHVQDGIVRREGHYGPQGDCRGWRGKHKDLGRHALQPVEYELVREDRSTKRRERYRYKYVPVRNPVPCNLGYSGWGSAQRRVRVWVYASEVGDTAWNESTKRFELVVPSHCWGCGMVTDWFVEAGMPGWAAEYLVEGNLQLPPYDPSGTGIFVVFTAVEVAEKRGRHWVRLPWCSRMQVHSVVDNWELTAPEAPEVRAYTMWPGRLVALPARRVAGMGIDFLGAWDFWAAWDGWDGWIDWSVCGVDSVDVGFVCPRSSIGTQRRQMFDGPAARGLGLLDLEGVLCRAGP
jgi:hypothetical protein